MKPLFHPQLVNDPFGDPGLYVEFMFEKRAVLFDMGELATLAPRKILRTSHAFITHTHMDHFMGFDRVVRVCLGRDTDIHLYGPAGFLGRVEHKLAAYTWNLVRTYDTDFTVIANEIQTDGRVLAARFRCRNAFQREPLETWSTGGNLLYADDSFRVCYAILDHRIPCLAFSLQETQHINIWKNRLDELGLPVGPWLRELKQAILSGQSDDSAFRVWWQKGGRVHEEFHPLGWLKAQIVHSSPGQKIGYVVDAVYHQQNAREILALVQDADVLFIEATFLQRDAAQAARKYHLTALQAGLLAGRAGVKRLVPMHFSARYAPDGSELVREAQDAFSMNTPQRVDYPHAAD